MSGDKIMHPEQNRQQRQRTDGESRGYRPEDTGRLDYQQSGQSRTEPDFHDDRDYSRMEGNRSGYGSSRPDRESWSEASRRGMGDREYQGDGNFSGGNSYDRASYGRSSYERNSYEDDQRSGSQQDRDWERARSAPQNFSARGQQGSWDRSSSMGSAGYRQSGLGGSQQPGWGSRNQGQQNSEYGASNEDWQSGIRGGRSSYNAGVDSMWSGGGQSFREGNRRDSNEMQGSHRGKGPKGYQRSDERIQEDISERLTQHSEIDATEIEVKVQLGEVTLTGTATDRNTKRMAEDIAESVSGVKEVTNQIRVSQSGTNGQSGAREQRSDNQASSSSSQGNRKGEQETAGSKK